MRLVELKENVEAVVSGMSGDQQTKTRLAALGLTTGRRVKLVRAAPFKGPLLVEVVSSGSRVMVAKKLADEIEVEPVYGA